MSLLGLIRWILRPLDGDPSGSQLPDQRAIAAEPDLLGCLFRGFIVLFVMVLVGCLLLWLVYIGR